MSNKEIINFYKVVLKCCRRMYLLYHILCQANHSTSMQPALPADYLVLVLTALVYNNPILLALEKAFFDNFLGEAIVRGYHLRSIFSNIFISKIVSISLLFLLFQKFSFYLINAGVEIENQNLIC